jgi:hypothetical protein
VLELVERVPFDQVENSRNGVSSEGFVAIWSIEESNEDRRLTHDEDWDAPHVVRAGISGVLVADRRQRSTRVDFGENGFGIDSASSQDDRQRLSVTKVAVASVPKFVESVVQLDERVRLVVAHGDSDLQSEKPGIGFGGVPHIGHAGFDVGLSETEGDEGDIPICSTPQSMNDVVMCDASVRASVIPRDGKGSSHL